MEKQETLLLFREPPLITSSEGGSYRVAWAMLDVGYSFGRYNFAKLSASVVQLPSIDGIIEDETNSNSKKCCESKS